MGSIGLNRVVACRERGERAAGTPCSLLPFAARRRPPAQLFWDRWGQRTGGGNCLQRGGQPPDKQGLPGALKNGTPHLVGSNRQHAVTMPVAS